MVISSTCPNSSLKSILNQTASQQSILVAMYSASTVLKATNFYFLLIHEIEVEPRLKQHPDVLLRSTTLPAQLASVYLRSVMLPTVYLIPWFIVPRRYLRRFWHQPSESDEAQPSVDSKCSLQNIYLDGCSLRTSGPLRVDDT